MLNVFIKYIGSGGLQLNLEDSFCGLAWELETRVSPVFSSSHGQWDGLWKSGLQHGAQPYNDHRAKYIVLGCGSV